MPSADDFFQSLLGKFDYHAERIEKLHKKIDGLIQKVGAMSINQSQFDTDLTNLTNAVTVLVAAYQSASAKAAGSNVDLSAEDAQVASALASINSALPAAPDPAAATAAPAGDAAGSVAPTDPTPTPPAGTPVVS
jgi:hypothetical protein